MSYKLHCKTRTADGHPVQIHRKRHALLTFRNVYYITIYSKTYYAGYRRAVIYGWTSTDPNEARREAQEWTVAILFRSNPYLIAEAIKVSHP